MSAPLIDTPGPELTIGSPRRLTTAALLLHNLTLLVPLLVITLMLVSAMPLGKWTYIIPAMALGLSLVFLPFFQGNAQIIRLVRSLDPLAGKDPDSFIVQFTLVPRVRSGFRAALEDADDVGCVRIEANRLVYRGDSIQLVIPRASVREVRLENIGWRGLFLYKAQIRLEITGLSNASAVLLVDRSSLFLPSSKRASRRLFEKLRHP